MISRIRKLFGGDEKPSPLSPVNAQTVQVFRLRAQYEVLCLKEFLGDDGFAGLRKVDMKIPSPGEIILSESGGLRLETIATNLKQLVARLDEDITSTIEATKSNRVLQLWLMMGRFDDLADVGSHHQEDAEMRAIVTNLLEYSLAVINELSQQLQPELIHKLVERFSAREALRAERLRRYVQVPNIYY